MIHGLMCMIDEDVKTYFTAYKKKSEEKKRLFN